MWLIPRFWSSLTGLDGGAAPWKGEEQEEQPDRLQFHHGGPFGLDRSHMLRSGPFRFRRAPLTRTTVTVCSNLTSGQSAERDAGPSAVALQFIHPPTRTQRTNHKARRRKTDGQKLLRLVTLFAIYKINPSLPLVAKMWNAGPESVSLKTTDQRIEHQTIQGAKRNQLLDHFS